MATIDLSDDDLLEMDDEIATHLPQVLAARELRRRRAAERTVPPAIRAGLDRYANHGIPPGHCLRLMLEGDLLGALAAADPETTLAMPAIVEAITGRLPSGVWGSREAVARYLEVAKWMRSGESP